MGKNTDRKITPADVAWKAAGKELQDVIYEKSEEGMAKITNEMVAPMMGAQA